MLVGERLLDVPHFQVQNPVVTLYCCLIGFSLFSLSQAWINFQVQRNRSGERKFGSCRELLMGLL